MESLKDYILHYFSIPQMPVFFFLTFILLFLIVTCLYIYSSIESRRKATKELRRQELLREAASLIERFYELVFSGTSILFFMTVYYLIERFLLMETYRNFWDKYHDFLLLLLIILSCVVNSVWDKFLVRLGHLTKEEKASIRLIGMVYMILIFAYIKFIYENNNYDMFITYFIGLMVGRFVYFDASFSDFLMNLKAALYNIPLMILLLSYTGILSLYGFKTDYLLIHNGVISNVFLAHVFMCISIFILHRILKIVSAILKLK